MSFRSRLPPTSRSRSLPAIAYGFHGPPDLELGRKKQDFLIKPKYQNKLPDIPCDPKHIVLPANPKDFELTGRELNVIYTQFTGFYCGARLDLVGSALKKKPSAKSVADGSLLHHADRFLLEDDHVKEKHDQIKRSMAHKRRVTWLRRPEYMTSGTSKFNLPTGEKLEFRVHKAINKKFKDDAEWGNMGNFCDRTARVKGIEDTFEAVGSTIFKHPSKANVYAEEVIPVFPDFDLAQHVFFEIVFDTSPSECANIGTISEDQMKEALLSVLQNTEDEADVERIGYFVPKRIDENDSKPSDADNALGKEYLLARDYTLKFKHSKDIARIFDTYAFIEKDGQCTYRAISNKVNLNRSIKTEAQSLVRNTKLYVKYKEIPDSSEDLLPQPAESELCFNGRKYQTRMGGIKPKLESDSSIPIKDDNHDTVLMENAKNPVKTEIDNSESQFLQNNISQPGLTSLIRVNDEPDDDVVIKEETVEPK
ncbi:unnamed protein product [Orchesella dallaii]